MKKLLIAGCTVFMLTLCYSPITFAQSPIGTITFLEGVGDVTRNNQESISLKENDSVFINDRIRTKSYSKLQITFVDKSVLKLAPGSCVTIEEFRVTSEQKREFARCRLSRGKLEAIVSKTGRPETFVIDTPNAKGAVKGSDIFVSYLGGRTGIFVKEGALSVWNPALPDTKATIIKGNCAFVPFNEPPGPARSMLDAEMLIHTRDVEHILIKKWVPSKGSFTMNAVIVAVSGTVRIYKKAASDWKNAVIEEVFEEGDTLQTAIDGEVAVRLNNGSTLLVAGNTELSVATLRYDLKSGSYENTFTMTHGRVGAVIEKLGKESTFQIKTPTVVCGVRGTLLEVIVPSPTPQEPAPQTQAFYEGGNGVVTSLLTQETQNVAAGEHVTVDVSGAISRPVFTTVEQRAGLIVNQLGMLSTTGGLAGLNNPGSLAGQTNAGTLTLAQASIAGAGVSSLTSATQNLDLTSTLLSGQTSSETPSTSSSTSTVIYSEVLVGPPGGALEINMAPTIKLDLLSDHTWTAMTTVDGIWTTANTPGGNFMCVDTYPIPPYNDRVDVAGVTDLGAGQWSATVSGTINDAAGATLTGTMTGTSSGLPFSGSGSGTWS